MSHSFQLEYRIVAAAQCIAHLHGKLPFRKRRHGYSGISPRPLHLKRCPSCWCKTNSPVVPTPAKGLRYFRVPGERNGRAYLYEQGIRAAIIGICHKCPVIACCDAAQRICCCSRTPNGSIGSLSTRALQGQHPGAIPPAHGQGNLLRDDCQRCRVLQHQLLACLAAQVIGQGDAVASCSQARPYGRAAPLLPKVGIRSRTALARYADKPIPSACTACLLQRLHLNLKRRRVFDTNGIHGAAPIHIGRGKDVGAGCEPVEVARQATCIPAVAIRSPSSKRGNHNSAIPTASTRWAPHRSYYLQGGGVCHHQVFEHGRATSLGERERVGAGRQGSDTGRFFPIAPQKIRGPHPTRFHTNTSRRTSRASRILNRYTGNSRARAVYVCRRHHKSTFFVRTIRYGDPIASLGQPGDGKGGRAYVYC